MHIYCKQVSSCTFLQNIAPHSHTDQQLHVLVMIAITWILMQVAALATAQSTQAILFPLDEPSVTTDDPLECATEKFSVRSLIQFMPTNPDLRLTTLVELSRGNSRPPDPNAISKWEP